MSSNPWVCFVALCNLKRCTLVPVEALSVSCPHGWMTIASAAYHAAAPHSSIQDLSHAWTAGTSMWLCGLRVPYRLASLARHSKFLTYLCSKWQAFLCKEEPSQTVNKTMHYTCPTGGRCSTSSAPGITALGIRKWRYWRYFCYVYWVRLRRPKSTLGKDEYSTSSVAIP